MGGVAGWGEKRDGQRMKLSLGSSWRRFGDLCALIQWIKWGLGSG